MSVGLVGRKCGMSRVFRENGDSVPVTVIEALPNRITTLKTEERDGYRAIQVTVGAAPKAGRLTKAEAGHFATTKVDAGRSLHEFRLAPGEGSDLAPGAELKVDLFKVGQMVDVSGITKGKGYAGVIKRHNFKSQRASHGNSRSHNVPGSISMAQDPGRVFPGKKMSGQRGHVTKSVQNLDIVRIDEARQLLLVRGAVPGHKNGHVVVSPAIKVKVKKGAN